MSRGLLLDTHTWLWLAMASDRIPAAALGPIAGAANDQRLYVAAISLYEMANLARRQRIALTIPIPAWFQQLLGEPQIGIVPLSPQVALATTVLPRGFHGDRLIAATAISEDLTLCTDDHALIRFGEQGLYEFLEI